MLLFVYGSLKEGFPNFHVNKGRRIAGEFRTRQPYPLYLADGALPCLLPLPGQGLRVVGQLFEVNDEQLAAMDRLERVGEPGGYARGVVEVEAIGVPEPPLHAAFVYMQREARLQGEGTHVGPIAEYTLEQSRALRW